MAQVGLGREERGRTRHDDTAVTERHRATDRQGLFIKGGLHRVAFREGNRGAVGATGHSPTAPWSRLTITAQPRHACKNKGSPPAGAVCWRAWDVRSFSVR